MTPDEWYKAEMEALERLDLSPTNRMILQVGAEIEHQRRSGQTYEDMKVTLLEDEARRLELDLHFDPAGVRKRQRLHRNKLRAIDRR